MNQKHSVNLNSPPRNLKSLMREGSLLPSATAVLLIRIETPRRRIGSGSSQESLRSLATGLSTQLHSLAT